MPTKTEQADLLQAMFGRNGESPVPIVAPASPADCFNAAIEAARIAVKYRTPVFLLSDGYLANGSEPWRIPDIAGLPDLSQEFAFAQPAEKGENGFEPFRRDPVTLARPWAIPGTPGLEHRIGGIEKADVTGDISYDPDNHDRMVRLRRARNAGHSVAQAHLRHLNPFPPNLGDVLRRYDRVLLPEINLGQLALLLRGRFLVDVISYNQVRGLPFRAAELAGVIEDVIEHA